MNTLQKRIDDLRPLFVEFRKDHDFGVRFREGDLWSEEPSWEEMSAEGNQRVADLEAIGRNLHTTPPQSLIEIIRTFGYIGIYNGLLPKAYTQLIFGWLEPYREENKELVQLDPKTLIHGAKGRRLHGLAFVNDPGDAPGHFYTYVEELPSSSKEYLWCYIGFDSSYPDGVRLAPIATDLLGLILSVGLGVTDVLLLPKKEAAIQKRRLEKVSRKRPELYRTATNDIEHALELSAGADIYLAKSAEYGPTGSWTLKRGREEIRKRLDAIMV